MTLDETKLSKLDLWEWSQLGYLEQQGWYLFAKEVIENLVSISEKKVYGDIYIHIWNSYIYEILHISKRKEM